MKTAIIITSGLLATPAYQLGVIAFNWYCSNPLLWTKEFGYLPLVALTVICFVLGRKYLVK